MINYRCPKCNDQISVPASLAGKAETCPSCDNVSVVPEQEVRLRRLVLLDERDRARAVLTVTTDGPVLALLDEAGAARLALSVNQDGPGLCLFDESGRVRAGLDVRKDESFLHLFDGEGRLAAGLGAKEKAVGMVSPGRGP